jgi:hypothetical protein
MGVAVETGCRAYEWVGGERHAFSFAQEHSRATPCHDDLGRQEAERRGELVAACVGRDEPAIRPFGHALDAMTE